MKQDPIGLASVSRGWLSPAVLSIERSIAVEATGTADRGPDELAARTARARDPLAAQLDRAYGLLLSGKVAKAFDIATEIRVRWDPYGRHMYGQSLCWPPGSPRPGCPSSRRIWERAESMGTHSGNFNTLKGRSAATHRPGVAAMLDDLERVGCLRDIGGRYG